MSIRLTDGPRARIRVFAFVAPVLMASMLVLTGCGGGEKTEGNGSPTGTPAGASGKSAAESATPAPAKSGPARQISAEDRKTAEMHFKTLCVTCHGVSGKGDGPGGKNLDPRPRNWTDEKWQDSVTDETLFKVILEGGAAAKLSPLMPPNLQFKDRPGVIWALVEKVRSYRGK